MSNDKTPGFFTQIPDYALKNPNLNSTDKIVYGEIYTMLNTMRVCFASNAHIADDIGVQPKTVSKSITKLAKLGFVTVKLVYKEGTKQIDKRYIQLATPMPQLGHTPCSNKSIPYAPNGVDPMPQLGQVSKSLSRPLSRSVKPTMSGSDEQDAVARKILNFMNKTTGRHYKPTATNLKLIKARMKDGFTFNDFKTVIAKKAEQWGQDTKMQQYLRPATLFAASKFEGYLNEQPVKGTRETLPSWIHEPDHQRSTKQADPNNRALIKRKLAKLRQKGEVKQ
ncbi:conserved phage C-terminal domain-containing protein [Fructilactobacillus cliffordii]|uniref:conserved phage C-terminal domain-containing protein n=1 Tax=Fructilactobacillus cliffordii TaxID=2940299 RepID=UPI0020934A03|nr:conserved phage C-terminal domain-containing protein [Fructilactobacillus cliffordii]USS86467.1 conserved phage C-terminal domain-containing protein [Fructilactobacillus cliffordii]